jgi:multimeric flavodoxin WrbA
LHYYCRQHCFVGARLTALRSTDRNSRVKRVNDENHYEQEKKMAKVIVFTGSPRKKGTTTALLAALVEGASAAGAEIVEYDLNDTGLRGCQGCMSCRREDVEACVQNDYLKPMYDDLRDAVGVVLGTPIYMGTLTAQSWMLLQRLYPAMGPNFSPRYPGKKIAFAVTQGNANAEAFLPAVNAAEGFTGRLGWEPVGTVLWPSAGGELPDDLRQAAFETGQKLVQ